MAGVAADVARLYLTDGVWQPLNFGSESQQLYQMVMQKEPVSDEARQAVDVCRKIIGTKAIKGLKKAIKGFDPRARGGEGGVFLFTATRMYRSRKAYITNASAEFEALLKKYGWTVKRTETQPRDEDGLVSGGGNGAFSGACDVQLGLCMCIGRCIEVTPCCA